MSVSVHVCVCVCSFHLPSTYRARKKVVSKTEKQMENTHNKINPNPKISHAFISIYVLTGRPTRAADMQTYHSCSEQTLSIYAIYYMYLCVYTLRWRRRRLLICTRPKFLQRRCACYLPLLSGYRLQECV